MNSESIPIDPTKELAIRVEQLSRLVELSKSVAAQLDLEPLLQQIVDTATELAKADAGGLLVLSEDEKGFQFFKVSGWKREPQMFPSQCPILNLTYRKCIPLRLADVRTHPLAKNIPRYYPNVAAILSVPLVSKEQSLGALFVGNSPGRPAFSDEDEEMLMAFAAQAAIAIENARLYERAKELARMRERERIANALHETLAQMIFSIGLEAEECINHPSLDEITRSRILTIRRLASRSSDELRSAIFALRSEYLPGSEGLMELLSEQINKFEDQTGIKATLICPERFPELQTLLSEAVYRIVREALSNVRKHSHASAVMISLASDQESIVVTIQDNGIGLSEPLTRETCESHLRFGVTNMRQLTEEVKGDFMIANSDDLGVIVKARFPLTGA